MNKEISYEELKIINENLQTELDYYKKILDNLPVPVFAKDAGNNFRYILCNKELEKIFGISRDDILGKTDFDIFNNPERNNEIRANDLIVLQQDEILETASEQICTPNGVKNISARRISIFDNSGLKKIILGNIGNADKQNIITENEQRFKAIINKSKDIYVLINEKGEQIFISNAAEKITGYKSEELYQPIRQLIHPDDWQKIAEAWSEGITDTTKAIRLRYRHIHKTKGYIWLEAVAQNFLDNPIIKAIICNVRDISEQKELELQQQKHAEELRVANLDKDNFIAILAHDLKSPFSGLLGLSETLIENFSDYTSDEIESYLCIINESLKKIYLLLEDLLLWSKSNAGKLTFNFEKTNLDDICKEVIENQTETAKKKNISININCNINQAVNADKTLLKAVLRNLINNAIKFTRKDGVININTEQNQRFGYITVSDNGVGMTEEDFHKLWEISSHHTTAGTAKEKGSGFGLILCRNLVEKMGGTITGQSEVGEGSTFIFTVPLLDCENE